MAVSTRFQLEIDEVDDTKTLVFTTDAVNYAINEWSYDGLEITGHDDFALEHGAGELLYAMGFRHYGPTEKFIKRPVSIPTNLTAAKQSFWMPYNRVFLAYGFDGRFATRAALESDHRRWQDMNNVFQDRLPAGHRWRSVILSAAGQAYFAANPSMIIGGDPTVSSPRFNLSVAEPDYTNMVNFCAAYLLDVGLNSDNRTNFDPTDGDSQSSDLVAAFTKAVVDKVRSGTDAIGTIDAQVGVPTAQLGIYAYAGHRLPPTLVTDLTGIYVQVALAFNDTGVSYQELINGWGALADFVAIREYFDVEAWYFGIPQRNGRNVRTYYSRYQAFYDAGVRGANGEFQANWLMNMAAIYAGIRVMKTGATDTAAVHDTVLAEMVADIFDDDPAVLSLLTLWASANVTMNKYSIRIWADYIDDMVDSWYKTDFEQYLVILYNHYYLPSKSDTVNFPTAFASHMSKVHAVTEDNWFHSYAYERRLANGNVAYDYPALRMYQDPLPDWVTNATAPTHEDFTTILAALTADASRQPELDEADAVLLKVTPLSGVQANNSTGKIIVSSTYRFCFVGPGTAYWTPSGGTEQTYNFGPGKHIISTTFSGAGTARAGNGGRIFVYSFPQFNIPNTGGDADLWMYVPNAVGGGNVDVRNVTGGRISFDWGTGKQSMTNATYEAVAAAMPAGQVRVMLDGGSATNGSHTFGNVNPWLSPYPNYALLSRTVAEEDFPALVKVNSPTTVGSDDSADPFIDETPEEIEE